MNQKPSRFPKRILVAATVLVVAAAGAGGYLYLERRQADRPPSGPVLVKMGEFVTNLGGTDNRRFIKIVIDMEAGSAEVAKELVAKTSQVRDQVFMVLRSKTVSDLAGPEGMRNLAADLVAGTNRVLSNSGISQVYFIEFAIQ